MSKKAYVLSLVGYEYNDEIYNRVDGVEPRTIYTDKAKAIYNYVVNNLKWLEENCVVMYSYEGFDRAFGQVLCERAGVTDQEREDANDNYNSVSTAQKKIVAFVRTLPIEQQISVIDHLDITGWSISEVEVEE